MRRGLVMVAHPDDCIIFAWSFMYHHPDVSWSICYLTYGPDDARAQEIDRFWARRSVSTSFLGYIDDYRDLETGVCSFDTDEAARDITEILQRFDFVVTHDQHGDYGHLHHKFVHQAVSSCHDHVVTFAPVTSDGDRYEVPLTEYDVSELPMHGSIIRDFHRDQHVNRYHVPDSVRQMLEVH